MKSANLTFSSENRQFYLVASSLILAAWVTLTVWQRSDFAELLGHESIGNHHSTPGGQALAFLLGWLLMTVAMMLPGSLPALNAYARQIRHRMQSSKLVGLTILGYLIPWITFGLLAYFGDTFLHHLAEPSAPLGAYSEMIAPLTVLIAGIYQFTPVKRRLLNRCRPSSSLSIPGNLEAVSRINFLQHGLRLGFLCVGSCWSLMLLMFALGNHRLDWMLILSGVMAAERLASWGYRLAWVVGIALLIWAAIWFVILLG
jgi:predicted metal-binding membrane protein